MDASKPTAHLTSSNSGAGDHDEPYRFGRRPTARAPFPFTELQYARLLMLRGRLEDVAAARLRPAA